MDIVTYRELKDKEDIFLLWAKSFGWHVTAEWVEKWIKDDIRLKNGPVGFCGLVDGQLRGFVGAMEIPTRNKEGETEIIGGIYAIATRPSANRQGIGKRLLEATEDYFRSKGYRLSMLGTSRSIVAYQWYSSVGYRDVKITNQFPCFYKTHSSRPKVKRKGISKTVEREKYNSHKVNQLFGRFTKKKCGFVLRDEKQLRVKAKHGYFDSKLSITTDSAYALLSRSLGSTTIMEIVGKSSKACREVIERVETQTKYGVIAHAVFSPEAQKAFERTGYRRDVGTYGVLMYKPLAEAGFEDLFDENFLISRIDLF